MALWQLILTALFIPTILGKCTFPDQMSGRAVSDDKKEYYISIDIPKQIALVQCVKHDNVWKYYDFNKMQMIKHNQTGCGFIPIDPSLTLPAIDPSQREKIDFYGQKLYFKYGTGTLDVNYNKTHCFPKFGVLVTEKIVRGYNWTYPVMTNFLRGGQNHSLYNTDHYTCKP